MTIKQNLAFWLAEHVGATINSTQPSKSLNFFLAKKKKSSGNNNKTFEKYSEISVKDVPGEALQVHKGYKYKETLPESELETLHTTF